MSASFADCAAAQQIKGKTSLSVTKIISRSVLIADNAA